MTRPLEETVDEAAKVARRSELVLQLSDGRLRGDAERLAAEELQGINAALAAIAEKRAPAPPSPAFPDVAQLKPAEAAAKAAAIRARPEYFKPDLVKDGKRVVTAEEHARLVQEHSELLARAAETT